MSDEVVRDPLELRSYLDRERAAGRSVALVPTLGALHAGHASLIAAAREDNDVAAVSVFLNPTQFNEASDLAAYPRDLAADVAVARAAGADVVFAPPISAMYRAGRPEVTVDPGPLADVLEGAARPGHFRGVATVVTKLFSLFSPCRAYFGEKDFQQLVIIRAIARELLFPIEVVACPTVRERDGLALSSRNARLDAAERRAAPVLYRALLEGRRVLAAGARAEEAEEAMARFIAEESLATLDYAVVREARSLAPAADGDLRLLLAAHLGAVRLIDNIAASDVDSSAFAAGAAGGGQ